MRKHSRAFHFHWRTRSCCRSWISCTTTSLLLHTILRKHVLSVCWHSRYFSWLLTTTWSKSNKTISSSRNIGHDNNNNNKYIYWSNRIYCSMHHDLPINLVMIFISFPQTVAGVQINIWISMTKWDYVIFKASTKKNKLLCNLSN